MSHIAAALAKSKGRDVKAPPASGVNDVPLARIGPVANPFLAPVAAPKVAPVVYQAEKPKRHFPVRAIALTVVALFVAVLGFYLWTLLRKDNLFSELLPRTKPTPVAVPAKIAPLPPTVSPPTAPTPSDLMREKVRQLPISSAAGGAIQRLTVGGKVYQPGETVTEGLILQAIETDEIVFRDTTGSVYTRRL